MTVSVVVPTRDRPAALDRCLAALRAQTRAALEVVVVDDGSVARDVVARVAERFETRLVRLEGGGPAAARNAGVEVASGRLVLLLDDDCVPHPGWAETLAAAGARAPRLVVAGAVVVPHGATAWLRASERIATRAEVASSFFRTLNLACSRDFLLEVPFDPSYVAAAGEDRDWCVRATRAGATFAREPAAIVEHRADLDARAFFRQQLRYGRAVHHLRSRGTHAPVSSRALGRAVAAGFRDGLPVGLAMATAQPLTIAGYVLERRSGGRAKVGSR